MVDSMADRFKARVLIDGIVFPPEVHLVRRTTLCSRAVPFNYRVCCRVWSVPFPFPCGELYVTSESTCSTTYEQHAL